MICTPSFSREEHDVARIIRTFLTERGIAYSVKGNNTWVRNRHWQVGKPVLLLDSHIDTVRPVASWTEEPFGARVDGDRIIGLGSNDAGASVVTLLAVFMHYCDSAALPWNLLFAASCEEEISGTNGLASILDELGPLDLAIVGEPTQMQLAIAEKGLMVLDCIARGITGHAARKEGVNALYKALDDINRLRNFRFPQSSELLGDVKISVTQIHAGTQHNVVPDTCTFVVDVRTNEHYSNRQALEIISGLLDSEVAARSLRLNSSGISRHAPIVRCATALGIPCYGSPTTSDQALLHCPSVKIGPGDSARSHTANEYIRIPEIDQGFETYIKLLDNLFLINS
jgi:acetylornithine deacetylase